MVAGIRAAYSLLKSGALQAVSGSQRIGDAVLSLCESPEREDQN